MKSQSIFFSSSGSCIALAFVLSFGLLAPGTASATFTIWAANYHRSFDVDAPNQGGRYADHNVDMEAAVDNTDTLGRRGGVAVGWTAAGEWLEYNYPLFENTNYTISVRYASGAAGPTPQVQFHLDGTLVQTVNLPATGGWQTYATVTTPSFSNTVTGMRRIRMTFVNGEVNVKRFTFNGGTNYNWTSGTQVLANPTLTRALAGGGHCESNAGAFGSWTLFNGGTWYDADALKANSFGCGGVQRPIIYQAVSTDVKGGQDYRIRMRMKTSEWMGSWEQAFARVTVKYFAITGAAGDVFYLGEETLGPIRQDALDTWQWIEMHSRFPARTGSVQVWAQAFSHNGNQWHFTDIDQVELHVQSGGDTTVPNAGSPSIPCGGGTVNITATVTDAGGLTASNIFLQGPNLLVNNHFEFGLTGWPNGNMSNLNNTYPNPGTGHGGTMHWIGAAVGGSGGAFQAFERRQTVSVTPNKLYFLSAWANTDGSPRQALVYLQWFDGADPGANAQCFTVQKHNFNSNTRPGGWRRLTGFVRPTGNQLTICLRGEFIDNGGVNFDNAQVLPWWDADSYVGTTATWNNVPTTVGDSYLVRVWDDAGNGFTSPGTTVQAGPAPAAPTGIQASPATICVAGSSTLSVNAPGAGLTTDWYTGVCGGALVQAGANSINVSPGATTTYYARTRDTGTGCISLTCAQVTVNVDPTSVGGSIAGGATPICQGSGTGTMTLSGHTGSVVRWEKRVNSGAWTNIANTTTTYSETPSSAGTWDYRAVVQSGVCASADSAMRTIVVNANPTATAANSGPTCVDEPLTLTGGPGGMASYSWTGPNGFTSGVQSPLVSASATTAMAGLYTLTVIDTNGCTDSAQTTAVVHANPTASAANSGPTCVDEPLTLTGGPGGMASYNWTGPNGFTSGDQSPLVSASATTAMAGTYTLTVTDSNGCTDSAQTAAVVHANPTASAANSGPVCEGGTLTLTGGPGGMASYSWTGPNSYTSSDQSPTVSTNATTAMAGTYTLTVTDSNGCADSANTVVTVTADNDAPNSSASITADTQIGGNISVNFTSTDVGCSGVASTALWVKVPGGVWADSTLSETGTSGSFTYTPVDGGGLYRFATVSQDNLGNAETAPAGNDPGDDSIVYNTANNAALTLEVEAGNTYTFPMEPGLDVRITVVTAATDGEITVSRSTSVGSTACAELVDLDYLFDESLSISDAGSLGVFTANLEWDYANAGTQVAAGNATIAYRCDGGALADFAVDTDDGSTVTVSGIDGFSDWYVGDPLPVDGWIAY